MPPLVIAGAIGAAGSVAGGLIGSSAAGHAADTQAAAANNAAQLERQSATDALNFNKLQYGNSLALLSPYYNTGVAANSRLAYLMGLNPAQGLPAGVVNPNTQTNGGISAISPADRLAMLRGDFTGRQGSNGFAPLAGGFSPMGAQAMTGLNDPTMPGSGGPLSGPNAGFGPPPTSGAGPTSVDGSVVHPGMNAGSIPNGGFGVNGQTGINDPGSFSANPAQLTVPANATNTQGAANGNVGGGFGSLAQGWNQTFSSPTGVTEQNDPGYQFRLQQGQNALQNSAAARGGLLSGATAKALSDYNQNAASGEYQNVYNRALQNYNTNYNTFTNDQTNLFNRLQALSGGGQVSANNLSSAGLATAGNAANIGLTSAGQIGQQLNNAGAATASGYIGGANAINGAIGNATNSLTTLALLRQLNGAGGSGAGASGGWGVT